MVLYTIIRSSLRSFLSVVSTRVWPGRHSPFVQRVCSHLAVCRLWSLIVSKFLLTLRGFLQYWQRWMEQSGLHCLSTVIEFFPLVFICLEVVAYCIVFGGVACWYCYQAKGKGPCTFRAPQSQPRGLVTWAQAHYVNHTFFSLIMANSAFTGAFSYVQPILLLLQDTQHVPYLFRHQKLLTPLTLLLPPHLRLQNRV